PAAYGHTGFTGTCVWVDPEADLVFIFLSNRTYPFPDSQRLLNEERVRGKLLDQVYLAMAAYEARTLPPPPAGPVRELVIPVSEGPESPSQGGR
ncbi:MAG: serine hydrolase, partial [Bacteroidia bacterium]|nr:serine hydrolase [Bacteroidia bacterium]